MELSPQYPMVPLFCNIGGTPIKCGAITKEKWNLRGIFTDWNGIWSLPHGVSHGEHPQRCVLHRNKQDICVPNVACRPNESGRIL